MCGIAGIVRFDDQPISKDRVRAMLAHLKHRGPDGDGVSEHGRCALVHTRLSIIDLLSGQQPMHLAPRTPQEDVSVERSSVPQRGSSGGLHLVFNGEIYNHQSLRKKLEKRGHVFTSTHSDTEVLLYGYRQWGENLPKHLHGMFAFAIWDESDRRLFVARDRAGKKPLFIRYGNDFGELIFGSLVGTVVAGLPDGQRGGVNQEALLNYLRLGYTFGQSMVDGVNELPAAHFMRIEHDGQVEVRRYWRPPPISKHSTALGAADALDEVLTEAVHSRLEADVPLGCFLSGGIDSSVIAAIAQGRLAERGERLRTFSVSMPDVRYDESPYARAVADHIGADHTVLRCEVDDAMADLERMMAVTGEPTADSSLLPTHWLCKTARPFCKAALSGDGGDELFGGYDRYRAMRLLSRHRSWLQALPSSVLHGHAKSSRARLGRLVMAAKAGRSPDQQYRSMIHLFSDSQIAELMPDHFAGRLVDDGKWPGLPDWQPWEDLPHAAMRWDFQHYLPFELLRKVDRAAMAVALEVRCPILDTQVCDLAGHLPTRVLMPRGKPKAMLREVGARYLPAAIVRRPKRGFAIPIGDWLRTRLRDDLHDRLFDGGLDRLGLNADCLRQLFDQHLAEKADHTHRLFALLQLSLWESWRQTRPTPIPSIGID